MFRGSVVIPRRAFLGSKPSQISSFSCFSIIFSVIVIIISMIILITKGDYIPMRLLITSWSSAAVSCVNDGRKGVSFFGNLAAVSAGDHETTCAGRREPFSCSSSNQCPYHPANPAGVDGRALCRTPPAGINQQRPGGPHRGGSSVLSLIAAKFIDALPRPPAEPRTFL